ncbi:hypothetical protein GOBAR_DD05402 [Gossypium barbadense]|nr:hypothetical protein GOBAR_DD05402 [Gossypium barbadense]
MRITKFDVSSEPNHFDEEVNAIINEEARKLRLLEKDKSPEGISENLNINEVSKERTGEKIFQALAYLGVY